jgi:hypothetical protein
MPLSRARSGMGRVPGMLMAGALFASAFAPAAIAQLRISQDSPEQSGLLAPFPAEREQVFDLAELAPQLESSQKPETAPIPDAPSASIQKSKPGDKNCPNAPCPAPKENWYMRFANGPQVKPLTPPEKGWLALRNVLDPFNAVTILGDAAISIGANSHSQYGPGMSGFGKYVGVSYTEDITGEFFNTFLICSLAHQDPHYHRVPHASYKRRTFHAISQVVWTQGDNERGMLNYANLVGFAIDDEIANLYVPGRQTNAGASAQRYAIGLATAPIDNFVTEFLPDVAKHIHVQVVIVQRIINQVARNGSPTD